MFKLLNKKRIVCVLTSALMAFSVVGGYSPVSKAAEETYHAEYQAADLQMIPDKYNTGAKGNLNLQNYTEEVEVVSGMKGDSPCSFELKKSDEDGVYMLNFGSKNNKQLSGQMEFSNYDFSKFRISSTQEKNISSPLVLVFNNCKFDIISSEYQDGNIKYVFNNCTIRRFWGSNATFDKCAFGGSWEDPLHPLRHVEIKNSYISDLNHDTVKGSHIDGVQIMGYNVVDNKTKEVINSIDAKDISFKNCRFEVPAITFEGCPAYVNACIMIQLEKSNGSDIFVEDCIVNGGGYTIYCQACDGASMENVSIKNVKVGSAQIYGMVYPNIDKNVVTLNSISITNSLYIGSVYKENGNTVFSVSNDTGHKRKLRAITDKGTYDFTIKAGPTRTTLENRTFKEFTDLPVDILETIEEDCSYVVFFDVTNPEEAKQIRYVNYTDAPVSFDKSIITEGVVFENPVILEGYCGTKKAKESVKYTFTEDGVLTISGTGVMEDYHSQYLPPWNDVLYEINKVVVEDGVKGLGNQAFNGCTSLESVQLPDTLEKIGAMCFDKCYSLIDINIPESLKDIGKGAFTDFARMMMEEKGIVIPAESTEDKPTPTPTLTPTPSPTSEPTPENSPEKTEEKTTEATTENPSVVPTSSPSPGVTATPTPVKIKKPAKPVIKSVKNKKSKKIKVKWKKAKRAKGYEVQYARNSLFTKSVKTKSTKKLSLTIARLKKNKKYYVRVRAYTKDSSGKKIYGSWSKVKKVKIKK